MNSRGIKTVIIILLALANLFLIMNIVMLNRRVQNIPNDMIENAAAILKENKIDADLKKIPSKKPADYIYEGVYYSDNMCHEIAKSFSGASDEEVRNGYYTIFEGEKAHNAYNIVMRDENNNNNILNEYKIRFADYLQIEIVKSNYWDGNAADEIEMLEKHDNFSRGDKKKANSIINNFLKKYTGQDLRTGFEITGLKKEDGIDKIRINQTADGLYIASHTAYLIINDGEVKYFWGRWYFGAFGDGLRQPLLDSVSILFKCLEKDGPALEGAELKNMEKEYVLIEQGTGTGKFYLAPSWRLVFYGGKENGEKSFSYNMIKGR